MKRRDKQLFQFMQLGIGLLLTAFGVAITYLAFEYAVTHFIPYLWDNVLRTDQIALLILPVSVGFAMLYFWAQHRLDPQSEKHEEHALGDIPRPTIRNYGKVLLLGFLSMLAGATLGVESILVPASIIVGAYVATRVFGDKKLAKVLGGAGFIALFTAFFQSFWMGVLSIYLLAQTQDRRVDTRLVAVGAFTSLATLLALKLFSGDHEEYLTLPGESMGLNITTIAVGIFLALAGYATTYLIHTSHTISVRIKKVIPQQKWLLHALIAGGGIGIIYLIGGSLIRFTGNLTIIPMLEQASQLGVFGLIGLAVLKSFAIGWSKALQFRGGLIFPAVFIASAYVDIVLLYTSNVNYPVAIIAVMIGAFIANRKLRILF